MLPMTLQYVGRLTVFNMGNTTRSRKHQDCLRSIVSMLRQTLCETATSCERVTKQNLQGVMNTWIFYESRTKKI